MNKQPLGKLKKKKQQKNLINNNKCSYYIYIPQPTTMRNNLKIIKSIKSSLNEHSSNNHKRCNLFKLRIHLIMKPYD